MIELSVIKEEGLQIYNHMLQVLRNVSLLLKGDESGYTNKSTYTHLVCVFVFHYNNIEKAVRKLRVGVNCSPLSICSQLVIQLVSP